MSIGDQEQVLTLAEYHREAARRSRELIDPPEYSNLLRPLTEFWREMIVEAGSAKLPFSDTAYVIDQFFRNASVFLWNDEFRDRYLGSGVVQPKYRVTINTAFEFVSRYLPRLKWRNPKRVVTRVLSGSMSQTQPSPDVMADLMGVSVEEVSQREAMQRRHELHDRVVTELLESYLNHSVREQPRGLEYHIERIIQDALLSGRGVAITRLYTHPASGSKLTGTFWVPYQDYFIDPDATDARLQDAKWVAIRHFWPYWKLEEQFGLPPGSLRGRGTYRSGSVPRDVFGWAWGDKSMRYVGDRHDADIIEWYEIWSTEGMGGLWSRMFSGQREAVDALIDLDVVAGRNVYLAIAEGIDVPLNMAFSRLNGETLSSLIGEFTAWESPFWKDGDFPVTHLDFFHGSGPWPLAPLMPAIGEIICLQILYSMYLQQAEANSQQIVAYLDTYAKEIERALDDNQPIARIKLTEALNKSINECVQFLNRPGVNNDLLQAITMLQSQIERKTSLSRLMFGDNPSGTQSRTAADILVKKEFISMVPEHMSDKLVEFGNRVADKELQLAYYSVTGYDVEPLLGPLGSLEWDTLFKRLNEIDVLRGMRVKVDAHDTIRMDRDRQLVALQNMASYIIPALQDHAKQTGDQRPLFQFIQRFAKLLEVDLGDVFEVLSGQQPVPMQQPLASQLSATQAEPGEVAVQQPEIANPYTLENYVAQETVEEGLAMPRPDVVRGAV